MFYESNLDVSAVPLDASAFTPTRNSSMTVFTQEELSGLFSFTPSAWKTPQPARTGESLYKDVAPITPSYFVQTPGAYRSELGTPSPSLKHCGVPEAHESPMADIGVTPSRIMGPHVRRDVFFEATLPSSPISILGNRRIYTLQSLRAERAQKSQKGRDDRELLDVSLFGALRTPVHFPTALLSGVSSPHSTPPQPRHSELLHPPWEASGSQRDVEAVDRTHSNGKENEEGSEEGTGSQNEDDGEDCEREEGKDNGLESEAGSTHHANSTTDNIHSQQSSESGSTATDGNVWWPFPRNRNHLLAYLRAGLSLRYLLPSSIEDGEFRCNAELKLVGEHFENWGRTAMCTHTAKTLESYQRHVKKHIAGTRQDKVSLDHIIKNVWMCAGKVPRQPKSWLRVRPWDPNTLDIPLVE